MAKVQIKRFTIYTIYSDQLVLTSEYNHLNGFGQFRAHKEYKTIYFKESEISNYYKEITYILLSRRYSSISPVQIIRDKVGLKKYSDEYILNTFKQSFQTISSPLIYCILRNGSNNYEINFFPTRDVYNFCINDNLRTQFIDNLIIKYNEIISRDLTLFEKLVLFKTSLEQLIQEYQDRYTSIFDINPIKHGLSKKPDAEYEPISHKTSLNSSFVYVPIDPEKYESIFPELEDFSAPKRFKSSQE